MRYELGDIVKLDLEMQGHLPDHYALYCPFVRVSADYEGLDEEDLWAYGNFYNANLGSVINSSRYYFNAEHSMLEGEDEVVSELDDPDAAEALVRSVYLEAVANATSYAIPSPPGYRRLQ